MIKTIKIFFTFLFVSITLNLVQAQLVPLSYNIRAANFTYLDTITGLNPYVTGHWNAIEFDIFIQQTNIPANSSEIMRFALGQYYINLNFGGLNAADTVGGYASFKYISGSTSFLNLYALPTGPKCVAIAPSSDLGAKWNGILGGYLNLYSNDPLSGLSNIQISRIYPGTKVGRYRLKKNITAASPSPYFPSVHPHFRWRIAPAITGTNSNPVSKIFAYNGLGGASTDVTNKGTFIMDTLTTPGSSPLTLNLKVIMEGLYNPLSDQMERKDSVTVILRNAVFPYVVADSIKSVVDSNSCLGMFQFPVITSGMYYIVVKHFNCIETWSKEGGEQLNSGTIYSYDFTTSVSQAFQNNLKLKGTKFCLYSGNVNQDYGIDNSDISEIENNLNSGISGNTIADLNGDDFVDGSDLSIVENNVSVNVIQP